MKQTFIRSLHKAWQHRESLVCIGLDPDMARLPAHLRDQPDGVFEFCRAIVDQTHDLVCAYKPQIAYFADTALEEQLQAVILHIKSTYPHIPVILDAKRGDIGSTAERYAREAFDRFQADAVTINPYMGQDSAQPFLERTEKGVIVLCRTSNPGGGEFQGLIAEGKPLYLHVAQAVAQNWNANGNCGLVVGATWPEQLAQVRDAVGNMPILVPGIGAQGGDIKATLDAGLTAHGAGLMINSARGIIFAAEDESFAHAARAEALALKQAINRHRR